VYYHQLVEFEQKYQFVISEINVKITVSKVCRKSNEISIARRSPFDFFLRSPVLKVAILYSQLIIARLCWVSPLCLTSRGP